MTNLFPTIRQYIAGAYFEATPVAVQAILNANISTIFAVLIWLAMDQIWDEKIKASGMCYGVVVGLAAISPSAGTEYFLNEWCSHNSYA